MEGDGMALGLGYDELVESVLAETRAALALQDATLRPDGRVMWKKPFTALLEVRGAEQEGEEAQVLAARPSCVRPDGAEEIGTCQKCTARVLLAEEGRLLARAPGLRTYAWPCTSFCQSSTHPYTAGDTGALVVLRLALPGREVRSEPFRIYTRKRRGAEAAGAPPEKRKRTAAAEAKEEAGAAPSACAGPADEGPAAEAVAAPAAAGLSATAHLSADVQETIARLENAVQSLQQQVVTLKEQNKQYFEDKLNSLVGLPVQKRVAVRAYQAPIPSLQSEMYSQVFETQLRNSNIDVEYYSYKRVGDKVITITVCKDEQAAKRSNELALYFLQLFTLENEMQIQEEESKILTL